MKSWSGIDWVLFLLAIFDIVFVITMIVIFCQHDAVPDTLILVVGACTFGECGFCRGIYKDKKNKERKTDEPEYDPFG